MVACSAVPTHMTINFFDKVSVERTNKIFQKNPKTVRKNLQSVIRSGRVSFFDFILSIDSPSSSHRLAIINDLRPRHINSQSNAVGVSSCKSGSWVCDVALSSMVEMSCRQEKKIWFYSKLLYNPLSCWLLVPYLFELFRNHLSSRSCCVQIWFETVVLFVQYLQARSSGSTTGKFCEFIFVVLRDLHRCGEFQCQIVFWKHSPNYLKS